MAAYRRVDGLKLPACTLESAAGPVLNNEYGRTFPFLVLHAVTAPIIDCHQIIFQMTLYEIIVAFTVLDCQLLSKLSN